MAAPLVVSKGWIVREDGRGERLPEAWRLRDLLVPAVKCDAEAVYVLDRIGASSTWAETGAQIVVESSGDQGGEEGNVPWRWKVSTLEQGTAFLCGGRGGRGAVKLGSAVSVVDVGADSGLKGGPWDGLGARELLRAFTAFRRHVGVDWSSGTGRTAERLILASHPRSKGGTLLDRSPVTPAVVEGSALEVSWQSWRRDLTAQEEGAGWVHVFDANAQFLGAWVTVELGHGTPVHASSPRFDKSKAGFWHFPGGLDPVPNVRPLLPPPWCEGREWYATSTVQRMLEFCDGLSVPVADEAWLWPARSRFLRGAAEKLREARNQAQTHLDYLLVRRDELRTDKEVDEWLTQKVSADAVLRAVKDLYRVETGRFGMAGRAESSPWHRPDWGHQVRAQARVNMHRRLCLLGASPIAIGTDGPVFVDDEPDPLEFARRINLPIGRGLGQYRHVASAPAYALDDAMLTQGTAGRLVRAVGKAVAAVMEQ